MVVELSPAVVLALGTAALLIGLAKGGLAGGLGPLITVLVSLVLPTRQAVGVLLPLLIVADVAAVWVHRRDWDRGLVRALLPPAAAGVVVASLFLGAASDRVVEISLAVISLGFVAWRVAEARLDIEPATAGRGLALAAGGLSGIASAIAHAGGPPVSIYLLAARTPPVAFAATAAVFFLVVNWLKVPGYVVAGLLDLRTVMLVLPIGLLVLPGIAVGRWLVTRIQQRTFDRVVLVLLTFGALDLLLG